MISGNIKFSLLTASKGFGRAKEETGSNTGKEEITQWWEEMWTAAEHSREREWVDSEVHNWCSKVGKNS